MRRQYLTWRETCKSIDAASKAALDQRREEGSGRSSLYTGQILGSSSSDQHHTVLLQVVALSGDVGHYEFARRDLDTRHLSDLKCVDRSTREEGRGRSAQLILDVLPLSLLHPSSRPWRHAAALCLTLRPSTAVYDSVCTHGRVRLLWLCCENSDAHALLLRAPLERRGSCTTLDRSVGDSTRPSAHLERCCAENGGRGERSAGDGEGGGGRPSGEHGWRRERASEGGGGGCRQEGPDDCWSAEERKGERHGVGDG